jgi:hypothetical protein
MTNPILDRKKVNEVTRFMTLTSCTPGDIVMILREELRVERNKIHYQLEEGLKKLQKLKYIDKQWSIEEECGEGWLRINLLQPVFGYQGNLVMAVELLEDEPQFSVSFSRSKIKYTLDELSTQYPVFQLLCEAIKEWVQFTHKSLVHYPTRFGSIVTPFLRMTSDHNYSFPMNQ